MQLSEKEQEEQRRLAQEAAATGQQTLRPHGLAVSRSATERRLRMMERYNRRARVTAYEPLTPTGTVRISFEVVDDQDFVIAPGMFVGIFAIVPEIGQCRSPYCVVSPPNADKTFQLLVRLVPEGPLSYYLGGLSVGDVIRFRGPTGRTMIPREQDTELVLMATGVGIGPLMALLWHLLPNGFTRRIRLFWGLRLAEDLCLTDDLDFLAARFPNFTYEVSLSQPPAGWTGRKGRITEAVPPQLETLGGKHFYLVGNGAMIEEMSEVLSDLGVIKQMIYEEHYFNFKHRPDEETLAHLRARFVAHDLLSPLKYKEQMEREFSRWEIPDPPPRDGASP